MGSAARNEKSRHSCFGIISLLFLESYKPSFSAFWEETLIKRTMKMHMQTQGLLSGIPQQPEARTSAHHLLRSQMLRN